MISIVRNNIINENLIDAGDNVLVALSGGPDSVFLFHALNSLKDEIGFKLYASHINHMYRGEAADHDEKFVVELCKKYNIRLFIKRKNASEYAKELGITDEEAGRKLRYGFFDENLSEIGGGKVALAHNLNDQSETVLQRIIRGTGVDGLKAMTFVSGKLIRPMLNIQKKDIINFLNDNGYEFCFDHTNALPIYGRNKIRLNLIPYLEENFNPNIQNTLFRMSRNMENDSLLIEKYMKRLYKEALIEKNDEFVSLKLDFLRKCDDNELARLIRLSVEDFKGNNLNVESKHIELAIELIKSKGTGKQIDFTDGIVLIINYDELRITKSIEKIGDFEYNISIDKKIFISEIRKNILLRVCPKDEYIKANDEYFVDYDKVKGAIKARNRRSKDTLIPFGMNGSKKIKNIFIDTKVPNSERDKKIILEDEEKIIFLEGYRIDNRVRVTGDTKNIMSIKILEE